MFDFLQQQKIRFLVQRIAMLKQLEPAQVAARGIDVGNIQICLHADRVAVLQRAGRRRPRTAWRGRRRRCNWG